MKLRALILALVFTAACVTVDPLPNSGEAAVLSEGSEPCTKDQVLAWDGSTWACTDLPGAAPTLVAGDRIPGMPTPTDAAGPMLSSSRTTSPAMALNVPR